MLTQLYQILGGEVDKKDDGDNQQTKNKINIIRLSVGSSVRSPFANI